MGEDNLNIGDNFVIYYEKFMAYVHTSYMVSSEPVRRIEFFSDLKEGDILYEIVENKADFRIIERKVEYVRHIKKKTHFTLEPILGMKDSNYCPYSNKFYTMSKQFNPIFVDKMEAMLFLERKFKKDRDYLLERLHLLSAKVTFLHNYAAGRTATRRGRLHTYENTLTSSMWNTAF
jgi:hypothetical protein